MNFRKLLYPFSILYDGITSLRNTAYDKGWLESTTYAVPIICVGNLSVGGTGKSPTVEYLASILSKDYTIAVLSRGYKRKTKGYLEVNLHHSVRDVGDEPLQIKNKFPEITVAVCADRRTGITKLADKAELILLDDAFQHRKVKAAINIVLTPFDDLFLDDLVLPAGNLRESSSGKKRADILIVTKCPEDISYSKLQEIQYRMKLEPHQSIYFSSIAYSSFVHNEFEKYSLKSLENTPFTLVTGIANPTPLVKFLIENRFQFKHRKFSDHHEFSVNEIAELEKYELILTTEKDYMRLHGRLNKKALLYLPIKMKFLYDTSIRFEKELNQRLKDFRKVI